MNFSQSSFPALLVNGVDMEAAHAPFPFMDLPTELRCMVFEFANKEFTREFGLPPWIALSKVLYCEAMPVFLRTACIRVWDAQSMRQMETLTDKFQGGKAYYVRNMMIGKVISTVSRPRPNMAGLHRGFDWFSTPHYCMGVDIPILKSGLEFTKKFTKLEELTIHVGLSEFRQSGEFSNMEELLGAINEVSEIINSSANGVVALARFRNFPLEPGTLFEKTFRLLGLETLIGHPSLKHIMVQVTTETVGHDNYELMVGTAPDCLDYSFLSMLLGRYFIERGSDITVDVQTGTWFKPGVSYADFSL